MKYNKSYKLSLFLISIMAMSSLTAQLQVGDTSPDFGASICMNGEDVNPEIVDGSYWSLHEEGAGKVTWINLFTSW